jgi:hypothetical protein
MFGQMASGALVACACLTFVSAVWGAEKVLKHGDGRADGNRSIGGPGEMVTSSLPADGGEGRRRHDPWLKVWPDALRHAPNDDTGIVAAEAE